MKLIGFTTTHNESEMIKYVMPYVERIGYDKFVVYDNQSTDNTVELLQKYDFVEVRNWDTDGEFSEFKKLEKLNESYAECKRIAKINTPDEELVWMSWTDFDEVIFCNSGISAKKTLKSLYEYEHYNCFDGKMLNLTVNKDAYDNTLLPHMNDKSRLSWCGLGWAKPILFAVNDFDNIQFQLGNQLTFLEPTQGKHIVSLANTMMFHVFHLKYIDKEIYRKRLERRENQDSTEISDAYQNSILASSFPTELYFALSGYYCIDNSDTKWFEGFHTYNDYNTVMGRFDKRNKLK